MKISGWRSRGLVLLVATLLGCSSEPAVEAVPVDVGAGQACALDGMLIAQHDGPKGQLLRINGERALFCDAGEVFGEWLDPVRQRHIVDVWFQALDDAVWKAHADGWERAQDLYFVIGSRRMGAMGPTLAPFREEGSAQAFILQYGGAVYRFADIDAEVMEQVRRQGIDHWTQDGLPPNAAVVDSSRSVHR